MTRNKTTKASQKSGNDGDDDDDEDNDDDALDVGVSMITLSYQHTGEGTRLNE